MDSIARLKQRIKATPLAIPYIAVANALGKRRASQSNEAAVLDRIISCTPVPRTFIEFGFSGWEFNCINLAADKSWNGLLLDGDPYNVTIAKTIYHRGIQARHLWITLETLQYVIEYAQERNIGVLSVDVDGNDYWFLRHLMPIRPAILVQEINVFMGLRPLAVPYDPGFDRFKKHSCGAYFGGSLAAFHHLCRQHGYSLVAMSASGVNAFFVRDDLLTPELRPILPEEALRDQVEPDGSIVPIAHYWQAIKDMPFVDVREERA